MPSSTEPSSPRPSFTEGIAQRVIEACKRDDPDARITYVGRDDDERTRVRVRSGNGASVQAMQRTLKKLMPFARVRTSEDVLDGSVQAEITVPTARDERALARESAAALMLPRLLSAGAVGLTALVVAVWLAAVAHEANEAAASQI